MGNTYMVKGKICKKETKIETDLSNLFNRYLEECPEMNKFLKTYNLSVEQYLCLLSEVLRLRKPRLPSDWLKKINVVSTNSPKAVTGP